MAQLIPQRASPSPFRPPPHTAAADAAALHPWCAACSVLLSGRSLGRSLGLRPAREEGAV